jgi:flagellar protein FlbD
MLTRLNSDPVVVNSDQIECVESTHDTVLSMVSGHKLLVQESMDEVIAKVVEFRRAIAGSRMAASVERRYQPSGATAEEEVLNDGIA